MRKDLLVVLYSSGETGTFGWPHTWHTMLVLMEERKAVSDGVLRCGTRDALESVRVSGTACL